MIGIDAIANLASQVVTRIWPDKSEAQKQAFTLALQEQLNDAANQHDQAAINATEAASDNIFVSGWRPFLGWISGASFAWQFVLEPLITYFCTMSGHPIGSLPVLDNNALNTLLFGMLGLTAARTVEKVSKK